jgi:hypothetical protein
MISPCSKSSMPCTEGSNVSRNDTCCSLCVPSHVRCCRLQAPTSYHFRPRLIRFFPFSSNTGASSTAMRLLHLRLCGLDRLSLVCLRNHRGVVEDGLVVGVRFDCAAEGDACCEETTAVRAVPMMITVLRTSTEPIPGCFDE